MFQSSFFFFSGSVISDNSESINKGVNYSPKPVTHCVFLFQIQTVQDSCLGKSIHFSRVCLPSFFLLILPPIPSPSPSFPQLLHPHFPSSFIIISPALSSSFSPTPSSSFPQLLHHHFPSSFIIISPTPSSSFPQLLHHHFPSSFIVISPTPSSSFPQLLHHFPSSFIIISTTPSSSFPQLLHHHFPSSFIIISPALSSSFPQLFHHHFPNPFIIISPAPLLCYGYQTTLICSR